MSALRTAATLMHPLFLALLTMGAGNTRFALERPGRKVMKTGWWWRRRQGRRSTTRWSHPYGAAQRAEGHPCRSPRRQVSRTGQRSGVRGRGEAPVATSSPLCCPSFESAEAGATVTVDREDPGLPVTVVPGPTAPFWALEDLPRRSTVIRGAENTDAKTGALDVRPDLGRVAVGREGTRARTSGACSSRAAKAPKAPAGPPSTARGGSASARRGSRPRRGFSSPRLSAASPAGTAQAAGHCKSKPASRPALRQAAGRPVAGRRICSRRGAWRRRAAPTTTAATAPVYRAVAIPRGLQHPRAARAPRHQPWLLAYLVMLALGPDAQPTRRPDPGASVGRALSGSAPFTTGRDEGRR